MFPRGGAECKEQARLNPIRKPSLIPLHRTNALSGYTAKAHFQAFTSRGLPTLLRALHGLETGGDRSPGPEGLLYKGRDVSRLHRSRERMAVGQPCSATTIDLGNHASAR